MEELLRQAVWSEELPGDQAMQTPEDVQAMLKLASLGWGAKRIAAELGCSRNTVRRYLRQGGWQAYRPPARAGCLDQHAQWLQDRFFQHRGNCDVVRQELQRQFGLEVSLRTVERAVAHLRREVLAQGAATIRFETPPAHQLQIDFGSVRVNDRSHAFCRYWDVLPRACAPYRARTKGKDERGVGYVKRNAIAGHRFDSLEDLHGHLDHWMRDVADVRIHGTTGEPPIDRFEREERTALRPLAAKAPFLQVRELTRRVHSDACVELDTNRYSVPWRLIGESVTVTVADGQVRIHYAGQEVASHAQSELRRQTLIDRRHLAGIVGAHLIGVDWLPAEVAPRDSPPPAPELLRPLQEYERALGGAW